MWKIILLLCLILFGENGVKNAECGIQNAEFLERTENVLAFADNLFDNEDYYRAIGEYQRFVFISKAARNKSTQKAMFRIGLCYQKSRQWTAATKYFKELQTQLPEQIEPIRFEIARTCYLMGEFQQAIPIFQSLTGTTLADYSQYMLGSCYLKQMDWTGAEDAFRHVNLDSSVYASAQEMIEFAQNGCNLPHKPPFAAGIMSMLFPGAGQMYLHRFGDGTFSMLLTLGTAWLGHHYFQQGDKTAGNILSGLGYVFYAGNAYGAAASAKLINASSLANYLEQIKEREPTIESWK